MYTFVDKGDNRVTMRPEGTAGVIRAFIEHKLHSMDNIAKLYYMGPMFRYERPQKGRYRQFHQIGVELTGVTDPMVDAQMLTMLCHFFAEIGLTEPTLQINSLGCAECRPAYRQKLKDFLKSKLEFLCEDCHRRYEGNPLRTLTAVCRMQEITADAPSVLNNLRWLCRALCRNDPHLQDIGTKFQINSRMVRGPDTIHGLLSSWLQTHGLRAQKRRRTLRRIEQLEDALPGIGFAMGVERIVLLLEEQDFLKKPDLFIVFLGESAQKKSFNLMSKLQRLGVSVEIDYEGKSLKSQMRRADKLKARFTLIIGENELNKGMAALKAMDKGVQTEIRLEAEEIAARVKSKE
jgi:histidyl-tRNA synthetase